MATTANPLQSAVNKWNRRYQQAAALGASPAAVAAVKAADLQKISTGGTGMSNQAALAAIQSASQGHAVNPPRPSSSSLFNIVGNVGHDVQGIVGGMAIGAAHLLSHPGRDIAGIPHGLGETAKVVESVAPELVGSHISESNKAWLAAHGYSTSDNLGAVLRDVAQAPAGKFVPGLSTVSQIASGKSGLENLARHPVSTAMDITAAIEGIPGAAAAIDNLAKLSSTYAGTISEEGVRLGSSIAEAVGKKQFGVAALRAARDGLDKLAGPDFQTKLAKATGQKPAGIITAIPKSGAALAGGIGKIMSDYSILGVSSRLHAEVRAVVERHLLDNPDNVGFMVEHWILPHEAMPKTPPAVGEGFGPTDPYSRSGQELAQVMNVPKEPPRRFGAGGKYPDQPPVVQETMLRSELERRQAAREQSAGAPKTAAHPNAQIFGQPMTWGTKGAEPSVSQYVREGIPNPPNPNIQIDHIDTGPEGWYVRQKGHPEAPVMLIPREGYKPPAGGPRVPRPTTMEEQLQASLENVQQGARASGAPRAQPLRPPPPPESYQVPKTWDKIKEDVNNLSSGMTDEQRFLFKAIDGYNREMIAKLPEAQRRMVNDAIDAQARLTYFGLLSKNGTALTTADMEAYARSLPDYAKDSFFSGPNSRYRLLDATHLRQMIPPSFLKDPEVRAAFEAHAGLWIPRELHDVLFGRYGIFAGEHPTSPILAGLKPVTTMFRRAMFLRPSTLLHVAIGGTIMMMPEVPGIAAAGVPGLKRALDMVSHHDPIISAPPAHAHSPDGLFNKLAGEKAGELVSKIPGGTRRMLDFVTGMQRALVYISNHDKAIEAGADEMQARLNGMDAINRVLTTMDQATPFEQQVMRQFLPFYPFQKHVFQYLTRFPHDHPFVADTIAKIGTQEMQNAQSGLPAMFQQMFTLGSPDQNGNVKAVDIRGFSPFRSFGNDFSLSGLAQSMNPLIGYGLQSLGLTAAAKPTLYPAMAVDPNTGALTAVAPPAGGVAGLASAFFPQFRTIDAMLGWNTRLKALKQADPSAYKAFLWQTAGVPFPQTINVPAEVARNERSLYTVQQRDVSSFLKTGDFAHINGYLQVPFAGKMWTPEQLQAWYEQQVARLGVAGPAAKAGLPRRPAAPAGATITQAAGLAAP